MTLKDIASFTNQQLRNLLISDHDVIPFVKDSLDRTLRCFVPNNNKYYKGNGNITVFHSGQYSIFIIYQILFTKEVVIPNLLRKFTI